MESARPRALPKHAPRRSRLALFVLAVPIQASYHTQCFHSLSNHRRDRITDGEDQSRASLSHRK